MDYWVYEHWTAENKARIHRGDCSFCNHGKGCHEFPNDDRNGRWRGPFETFELAETEARGTGRPVSRCSYCLRGQ